VGRRAPGRSVALARCLRSRTGAGFVQSVGTQVLCIPCVHARRGSSASLKTHKSGYKTREPMPLTEGEARAAFQGSLGRARSDIESDGAASRDRLRPRYGTPGRTRRSPRADRAGCDVSVTSLMLACMRFHRRERHTPPKRGQQRETLVTLRSLRRARCAIETFARHLNHRTRATGASVHCVWVAAKVTL
jgi:hypothetical protein